VRHHAGWLALGLLLSAAACGRDTAQAPEALPPEVSGACATAHPLATEACRDMLKQGGNAMDAAVAASAVLAVVEPTGSGMGGGGFWLIHRAEDGLEVMIDGRETAPLGARLAHYLDDSGVPVPARSLHGPLAAGIPGQPAALDYLARTYGQLPLADSLAAAERHARDGFAVDDQLAEQFARHWRRFDAGAQGTFAIDGRAPREGEHLKQPDLAALFAAMRTEGAPAFYRGAFAEKLVAGVNAAGGHWHAADLRGYRTVAREPVVTYFRDARIVSAAPPSAGGIALATLLGQLEALNVSLPLDDAGRHLVVEAMRRAYADRARHLGDTDFVWVPRERLTGSAHARRWAATIDRDRATPSDTLGSINPVREGNNTTHLSVMDADGNRVAATLSINIPFGAAMVVPGTGVLLNNELDDFAMSTTAENVYGLIGSEPNLLAPGKRPLSSMTPTFVTGQRGTLVVGTPGGSRIITMVLLAILEWLGGASPEAMAAAERFHHQFHPDEVSLEQDALGTASRADLEARGHVVTEVGRRYGNLQAVGWEAPGGFFAVSDPRGVGAAWAAP
jgi:gamma-glutamyltranspeptidase / glutathione hydrolase